ncbi:MAG: TIM barrel protein [Planctomycetota bacterium]
MATTPTLKQSVITAFLGKTQDRFSEYQRPTELRERLEMVSKLDGYTGVEVVYPYETGDAAETDGWMKELGLSYAAINANIKKEAKFVPGAISRPDKAIRDAAVQIIKNAKDFAETVGAPHVSCCPLSDGYDQLFQVDYGKAFNLAVETIAEAADYKPEIPLFVEYKFNETRVHCLLDTCAKTLLLLNAAKAKPGSLGVTIDFGHSMYAQENPAQCIALCAERGTPYYLHTNDNDARHDWDLIGASRHFLHYVEFMFYAAEYDYPHYFTTDASPRIFDMHGFFTRHHEITNGIWNLVHTLDRNKYRDLMAREDFDELMRLVNKEIYRV